MTHPNGSIPFEAGGAARVLRLGINELCFAEQVLGKSAQECVIELELGPRITTVRGLIWAGCGDREMTIVQAGEIVEQIGFPVARDLCKQAMLAAFPPADPKNDGTDDRPPNGAAG